LTGPVAEPVVLVVDLAYEVTFQLGLLVGCEMVLCESGGDELEEVGTGFPKLLVAQLVLADSFAASTLALIYAFAASTLVLISASAASTLTLKYFLASLGNADTHAAVAESSSFLMTEAAEA
jgi:hypothetical protein